MSDDLNESLGSLLTKTKRLLDLRFYRVSENAGFDITPEQWSVLVVITHNPGIMQSQIAKHGFKDKTNVTRILDVLEKKNLVLREKHASDGRAFSVCMTAQGKTLMKKLVPLVVELNREADSALQKSGSKQLKALLIRLKKGLEKQNSERAG